MRPRHVRHVRLALAFLLLACGMAVGMAPGAPGAQASVSATPVTVSGTGAFANLKVTVSQTTNLINQAISVSWTGGTPTTGGAQFLTDYLQIMQCWGDDPAGPAREQCQFGGLANSNTPPAGDFVRLRQVGYSPSQADPKEDPAYLRQWQGMVPFHGVNGKTVTGNYNEFYDAGSTNEIPLARTRGDGTGTELFETQTNTEAPGLGCGFSVSDGHGGTTGRSCWLVIVPRGHTEVNGASGAALFGQTLYSSPLASSNWANRIVVRLGFQEIGKSCTLGANERRLSGEEMVTEAVNRWQPALCASTGTVFGFGQLTDNATRGILNTSPDPGMGFVSAPVAPSIVKRPIVYAPVAVSGLAIAFFVERQPDMADSPAAVQQRNGVRFTQLNLTPRLVAKLLSQSYRNAVTQQNAGLANNPIDMTRDPEFLAANPDYVGYNFTLYLSDIMVPLAGSDAINQLWRWVDADPAAHRFLAGTPDENGMTVNPAFKSVVLPTDNLPKPDTGCAAPLRNPLAGQPDFPGWCTLDAHPYTVDMHDAGRSAGRGDTQARNYFDATLPTVLGKAPRQAPGQRGILALVDAATAVRYGLPTAALATAGGQFVAPDANSLLAGVASMKEGPVKGVLEPSTNRLYPNAYPLTTVTYAATPPSAIDAASGHDYQAFLKHAAGAGQQPGVDVGQLPFGYLPLPQQLRDQTLAAGDEIATLAGKSAADVTAVIGPAGGAPTPPGWSASGITPLTASGGGALVAPGGGAVAPGTADSVPSSAPAAPASSSAKPGPKAVAVVGRTPGQPVPGAVRYLLVALLIVGALAAGAGPVLNRLGARTRR